MITSPTLKSYAQSLGFDLCGISPAESFPELQFLKTWLARRYYGTMTWLPRSGRVRSDVRQIMPSAQSVVVTGTVYNTDRPYSTSTDDSTTALISRYAWGEDYHLVVGRRLDRLLEWMATHAGKGFEGRRYVDTGPVQERVYAQYAGLGWIGKNTCLINPERGSWIFLGVVITNLALDPDQPMADQCGTCQLCLQSCPTGALVEPHVLDARRCLSYLTIEKRGSIDEALRPELGSHVYGCDICQEVCPYNNRPLVVHAAEWQPKPPLDGPSLIQLWRSSDAELAAATSGTAMTRASVVTLRRNLALAIGNAGDALPAEVLSDDDADTQGRPSVLDPAVSEAVAWARSKRMNAGSA
jgi:epoxyqueuosine reductase